jgi:hypothetical protein
VQCVKVFGDPATNDGWGPDLCGRLLYKDVLRNKFCKSVEFNTIYGPEEKVNVFTSMIVINAAIIMMTTRWIALEAYTRAVNRGRETHATCNGPLRLCVH